MRSGDDSGLSPTDLRLSRRKRHRGFGFSTYVFVAPLVRSPTLTYKILIADDEPDLELLIRQRFRKQIRDKVYDFVFAHNGAEAIEILKNQQSVDLILTDINMPVMDGLTLLTKVAERDPLLLAVVISAYGDMKNIRTAMNRGAFDFLTKPIDFEDFELTLNKSIAHARGIREASRARQDLAALQRELTVAKDIQQSILPRVPINFAEKTHLDLFAKMIPAQNVGGDFYDFFWIGERKLGVVVGDVSGKGIGAALFMAISRTLLRAVAMRSESPGACLREVNAFLCRDNHTEQFVTLFYGILNLDEGTLRYANGAHDPPRVLRQTGDLETVEPTGDTVLGILEDLTFQDRELTLRPGELVFLNTDGVTDALNPNGESYGDERLNDFLKSVSHASAQEIVLGVVDAVAMFSSGASQWDDITALALRYLGSTGIGGESSSPLDNSNTISSRI
ncbi:response regulator receiver modulated serine phosphatase [Isosphaera pallida ATCC 43644]|uniref:Response regulator receiver modulated serine phosphatase n=1 Tax=Isosphaera pallida (strain ATCC 43644 / DSM 9630 / IS1B) TaxID=575540 RepID=E8R175_ISOPI|nr:response regulator receiver modulated serine phosphatase [Isosphaera pallida ATCC 43644]